MAKTKKRNIYVEMRVIAEGTLVIGGGDSRRLEHLELLMGSALVGEKLILKVDELREKYRVDDFVGVEVDSCNIIASGSMEDVSSAIMRTKNPGNYIMAPLKDLLSRSISFYEL